MLNRQEQNSKQQATNIASIDFLALFPLVRELELKFFREKTVFLSLGSPI